MSETTTTDVREASATEPSATETQIDPQPATRTDPAPGAETTTPEPESKPLPGKPHLDFKDKEIRRIAEEQRETRRQLRVAQEQLERIQPRDPNAPPSPEQYQRDIEVQAQKLIEQREIRERTETAIAAGNAEYPDFNERCNQVAQMGAAENAAFMGTIWKLPAAPAVIAQLSENPAETARILSLSPIDLALELAAMSHRITATPAPTPAPKPTTQAPPPIRPLATQARTETRLEDLDGDAYLAAYRKSRAK